MNLGNPDEFTILELANMVIELTGSRSKIIHKDLPVDDPTRRRPDITLAKQKLGWQPQTKLRDGLGKDDRVVPDDRVGRVPCADAELLTAAVSRRGAEDAELGNANCH